MTNLSIVIPSYRDPLLQKTVNSLLENAEDSIEIIVILDGYIPAIPLKEDSRIKVIHLEENHGMRNAINTGLAESKGKFIMKIDEHCVVGPGYDKIMTENCAENWLMIPRRYSLDEENWKRNESKPINDYHYLSFPQESQYGKGLFVVPWHKDNDLEIDDTMTFQGSCWLANRKYFMEHVGLLDDSLNTYGTFVGEQHEIGLKYWLSGGEVKIIKKTWYAHLCKRKRHHKITGKRFKIRKENIVFQNWTADHWINNKEPNMVQPFSWLIKKFWPIPTWPDDWQKIYDTSLRNSI